jgi:hypothetical protein
MPSSVLDIKYHFIEYKYLIFLNAEHPQFLRTKIAGGEEGGLYQMSLSEKIDLQRDFAAGVLSVWGPLSSYDHILPPLTHCIRVYSTLIHTGEGGRG